MILDKLFRNPVSTYRLKVFAIFNPRAIITKSYISYILILWLFYFFIIIMIIIIINHGVLETTLNRTERS